MAWTTWSRLLEQRRVEVGEKCVDVVSMLFVVVDVVVPPRWRGLGRNVLETGEHGVEHRLHLVGRGRFHHRLLL
jgi:hypothetical protein